MNSSRRTWLKTSAMLTALAASGIASFGGPKSVIKISACDWSLGKSSDPGSFVIAKQIGLQGVQLNLGNVENDLHLRRPDVLNKFLAASKQTGIGISSIAIAEMNRVPYKTDPRTDQWVSDAIDVAVACGVSVILLAFFDKGDLRNDPNGMATVISKLKKVAPKAEAKGIVLGIESYLSAPELINIIDSVGSPNVKVYYDFRNSADAGYDVIGELKLLGKDRICELHMKENGSLLRNGSMDWTRICDTLNSMDFIGSGWMQIEGGRPQNSDVVTSYKDNLDFLKKKFGYA
ncbi:sugar phosphate isomerase/epimerase family protein [Chryseolinea sp. T2]|uniref:sugar phosphate isomerase/epimerase family protein n=1 Tax=Chryseolinea sp. T2 TaxID=3129255 RepID=UPI00307893C4